MSKLGLDITSIRKDITWVNIDPYYKSPDTTANPEICPEDIVNPSARLVQLHGKVYLVYSYWMLPHLSLTTDNTAKTAVINMSTLLNDNGTLIVGPVKRVGIGLLSPWRYKGTVKLQKSELSEKAIKQIVRQTKLWWLPRHIQKFSNKHNVHILKRFVGGKD